MNTHVAKELLPTWNKQDSCPYYTLQLLRNCRRTWRMDGYSTWGYWPDIVDDFKIHPHTEFKTPALWKMLLKLVWLWWLGCWLSPKLPGK